MSAATGFPRDTATQRPPSCGLCGRPLREGGLRTPVGEFFCLDHRQLGSCRVCAAPVAGAGAALCRTCARGAVLDQDGVKRVLPAVRAGLHRMELRLMTPVRVRLVPPAEIAAMANAELGKVTGVTVFSDRTVVDLTVVEGLSRLEFGATVAHECMHAWFVQLGFPELAPPTAEGLCQMAADGWLRQQPGARSALLRDGMANDPDPVYGDGFRQARRSVRRYGLPAVLRTVRSAGRLPPVEVGR